MIKFYEVRIVKGDKTHFHKGFLSEENATKEAKRENKTAPKGTTFVVKAHAFADGNEFMLLSEK